MSTHHPLPAAWVERLFARFAATWGVQRLGAMFPVETHVETKRIWAEQLGRFEAETLRLALHAAINQAHDWPPTLDEFIGHCERQMPVPARVTPELIEREIAAATRAVPGKRNGRAWANRILDRHSAGEPIAIAVLEMARRALGLRSSTEVET